MLQSTGFKILPIMWHRTYDTHLQTHAIATPELPIVGLQSLLIPIVLKTGHGPK
jgi:hypothetical protein